MNDRRDPQSLVINIAFREPAVKPDFCPRFLSTEFKLSFSVNFLLTSVHIPKRH